MRLRVLVLGSWAVLGMGVAVAAADPVTLTVSTGPTLQQTVNHPCVIGDLSCVNPASLSFTVLPPNDAADVVSSPSYTVTQIRSLVGDTFSIGVDLNQAAGQNGGAYLLNAFTLSVDNVTMFSTAAPMTLTPLNNGNGFSDAVINGFDLTGLAGDSRLTFTTNFSGGTAGREQYFLAGAGGTSATPEPATLLLLGSGALGLIRRKARQL